MQLSMGRLFSMLVDHMDATVHGEAQPRMLLYSGHDTWVRGACMTLSNGACTRQQLRRARCHAAACWNAGTLCQMLVPSVLSRSSSGAVPGAMLQLALTPAVSCPKYQAASICARLHVAAVLLNPGSKWRGNL